MKATVKMNIGGLILIDTIDHFKSICYSKSKIMISNRVHTIIYEKFKIESISFNDD